MNGETGFSAAMLALMLILPVSALAARRLPISSTLKMAAAWIAIFAFALLAVTAVRRSGLRASDLSAALGLSDQIVTGGSIRIPRGPDGHFWTTVTLNRYRQRMLIDTGATTTAISAETARAAGITVDDSFGMLVDTANGTIIAHRATAASVAIGPIKARDLALSVAPSFGDGMIGMNFLSNLKTWRVEGDEMVLEPYPTISAI
ncbi:TIGR02281 family clan AA aspartic protease [Sphingomonas sp. 28-63-12]|uniref:retropepsin-like aspartic protease family protein n=1 Tax=Sphingomonas sp. 28-63-12 TaxID=1970434 RepID=UPI000BC87EC1|nr:MAG: hypothetical protein B7Y47_04395 [Sphingomonas sp. 28-63-12]